MRAQNTPNPPPPPAGSPPPGHPPASRRVRGGLLPAGALLVLLGCVPTAVPATTPPAMPLAPPKGPAAAGLSAQGAARGVQDLRTPTPFGARSGSSPTTPAPALWAGGSADREAIRRALFKSLETTPEDRERMARLEQGTPEWLDARANRLTASNFGAAAGHNRYKSPRQLVHDMLYGTFEGNDATRWGNAHEDVACDEYLLARRARLGEDDALELDVTHSGLNVDKTLHWLAVSPDGHVHPPGGAEDGILEIKCPYSQRIYPSIPPYYADQMQGLMGVLGKQWADFCVWTPQQIQITRVKFEPVYWEQHLLPALKSFYNDLFVPAYVEREIRRARGDMSVPAYPQY